MSASAVLKSVDPKAGGEPGRNWLADVRNQGVTPGMSPPATGTPDAFVVQNPVPIGGAGLIARPNPSPRARVTISAPTARPIAWPRVNDGCSCPGPALACSVTRSSNDCVEAG